jgi:hypothetical protein
VLAGTVTIALAAAWSALVADVLIESSLSPGSVALFGRELFAPGITPATLIVAGLAASAGLAVAAAVAFARGRRLERRIAAELDERYRETATKAAGDVARAALVSWRVAELRTSLRELLARRDQLLTEMERARRRTDELRALADDYRRSVEESQRRLIVIPDLGDELAKRRARRRASEPG